MKVTNEIKELFKYITRYQPEVKDLESQLRPFVPDYFPAVGEVDAYIKMPRPDNKEETLGLNILVTLSLSLSTYKSNTSHLYIHGFLSLLNYHLTVFRMNRA